MDAGADAWLRGRMGALLAEYAARFGAPPDAAAAAAAALLLAGPAPSRPPTPPTPQSPQRPPRAADRGTVDYFAENQVRAWSRARLDAWRARRENPGAFYYRFVDPTVGQANGSFSAAEHALFLQRCREYAANGWPLGTDWGLFSLALPHKVGYQCCAYYRKLVKDGAIADAAFARDPVSGDLRRRDALTGSRLHSALKNQLSPLWASAQVLQIERDVCAWIEKYHGPAPPQLADAQEFRAAPPPDPTPTLKATLRRRRCDDETRSATPSFVVARPRVLSTPRLEGAFAAVRRKRRSRVLGSAPCPPGHAAPSAAAVPNPFYSGPRRIDLAAYFRGKVALVRDSTPLGREEVELVRVPPPPVKRSWALPIAPYLYNSEGDYREVLGLDGCCHLLRQLGQVEAIILNPPWRLPDDSGAVAGEGSLDVASLRALPIDDRLIPRGFLLVWVDKCIIAEVVELARSWNFLYVENIVWVQMSLGFEICTAPSKYARRSKLSLLIFRKEGALELRHQRSADVCFDFEQSDKMARPSYVLEAVEVLLPQSAGKRVILWAPKDFRRLAWTSVHVTGDALDVHWNT